MKYLGDFSQDKTIYIYFTTNDKNGGAVAPSTAFEAADVKIYKNGSATEKTTTNGVTMTSPFDTITGLHLVSIDMSNDTGDSGFWVGGAEYSCVLSPDETVDTETVVAVIGTWSVENRSGLRPTTSGRTLDVTSTGTAGVDWGNVENATTTVDLSATSINLVDTCTANTDMVAEAPTASANADAVWDEAKSGHTTAGTFGEEVQSHSTSAEITALNDFDPANDTVASVTSVGTCTTNTDMRGTDNAALASNYTSARAGYLDNLNIAENVAGTSEITGLNDPNTTQIANGVWDHASAITTDFGTLIERLYQWHQNRETITNSTGSVTLRNIGNTANLATWSITDDDTTTTRTEVAWT